MEKVKRNDEMPKEKSRGEKRSQDAGAEGGVYLLIDADLVSAEQKLLPHGDHGGRGESHATEGPRLASRRKTYSQHSPKGGAEIRWDIQSLQSMGRYLLEAYPEPAP
jgi:hypothetical protein